MRVAMIIQRYHPHIGGAERQIAAIAPRLVEQDIEVRVLTRRYDPQLARYEKVGGIPVYRLPASGLKPVASISFTLAVQAHLFRWRPDVIHAHELLSPATTAILAKRLFDVPIVVKVLNGGTFGDVHKLLTRSTGKRRFRAAKEHVDRFITISSEIQAELTQNGVTLAKQAFIPNGVDIEHFAPVIQEERAKIRQERDLPEGPIVLYSGRLAAQKRIDLLLDAWQQVQQAHPHANLVILGTGELESQLKKQALEYRIRSEPVQCANDRASIENCNIYFLDKQNDVAPFLKAADLFVLPSDAEGLSNSLLEAMASGLPAVVTNVGAAPELVKSGETGWLIPPGDRDALSAALCTALDQFQMLPLYGTQAREFVVRNYSISAVVEQLIELYKEVQLGASKTVKDAPVVVKTA